MPYKNKRVAKAYHKKYHKIYGPKYYKLHIDKFKLYDRCRKLKKYNLTIEQYNEMFEKQNGCCAICDKHQSELTQILGIDHNHTTGDVRGLLCTQCNSAIGMVKESIELLEKCKQYLQRNKNV